MTAPQADDRVQVRVRVGIDSAGVIVGVSKRGLFVNVQLDNGDLLAAIPVEYAEPLPVEASS